VSGQPGYQRGDRIALDYTADPHTRLQPGDEGTVTSYDPRHAQFSERLSVECALDLGFYVACMSVTCREGIDRGGFPARPYGLVPAGVWFSVAAVRPSYERLECDGRAGSA
jgi:hypothetical protein